MPYISAIMKSEHAEDDDSVVLLLDEKELVGQVRPPDVGDMEIAAMEA